VKVDEGSRWQRTLTCDGRGSPYLSSAPKHLWNTSVLTHHHALPNFGRYIVQSNSKTHNLKAETHWKIYIPAITLQHFSRLAHNHISPYGRATPRKHRYHTRSTNIKVSTRSRGREAEEPDPATRVGMILAVKFQRTDGSNEEKGKERKGKEMKRETEMVRINTGFANYGGRNRADA